MRISDWSSDVCSSDLRRRHGHARRAGDSQPVTDFTEPRFDHAPRPMAQRVGAILWPSFFAAGVATMVFFAFVDPLMRSEEHTSELQSLMRISYAVFCLKKKTKTNQHAQTQQKQTNH